MKLFITGASGFIGSHLLDRLEQRHFETIFCLTRDGAVEAGPKVRIIRGGLFDAAAYASALVESDVVLHLAAATGAAPGPEHFRINAEGTEFLLEQCKAHGVGRFLYVSSIAARFADTRHYPYAQSKQRAEAAVRASGLAYTIVRPTIVLGRGSPVGMRLQRLVGGAFVPMIGSGAVRVQPIDVDDLADLLIAIVTSGRFRNEVLELGGPEVLTMQALLTRMHRLRHVKPPRVVHVPLAPLQWLVALAERLPVRLPISAGQFASFANDGTAEPNDLTQQHWPGMKSIDETLQLLTNHG